MLLKTIQFLKKYQDDIVLLVGVILISLLSFAVGYIVAKQQEKEPIRIEYNQTPFYENKESFSYKNEKSEKSEESKDSYYRSRNLRTLSGLEIIQEKV